MDLKCSMCFFRAGESSALIRHIVRFHKTDPRFKVNCTYEGCSASYTKWSSFKQHVYRKHPTEHAADLGNDAMEVDEDLPGNEEQPPGGDGRRDEDAVHVSPEDFLTWQLGMFLVTTREECKISQTAMETLVSGLQSMLHEYHQVLLGHVKDLADQESGLLNIEMVEDTFQLFSPDSLLSQFKSKYVLDKFLEEKCGFIPPEKVKLGTDLVWKKGKNNEAEVMEKDYYAYCVPFLKTLKDLLQNEQIRHCVDNPRPRTEGWYKTVLDGSWYQSSEVFAQHPNSLAIISYYDDLKVTNIVGAAVGETKLAMFYWTLGNIYPELRSKLKCVNLLCIVEYKALQKFGVSKVLQPFVNDLNTLQREGVSVSVDGVEKIYKGSLLFHTGDTPASALIGGFKQSVSANRFCRTCNVKIVDWKTLFDHFDHILRDLESHNVQLAQILNEGQLVQMRDFWKKKYGVNGKSVLSDVVGFDVTKCLPHDVMHILCEGAAEVHLRVYLKFLVENKVLSLKELNAKLLSSDFQQFSRDKPAAILTAHLDNGLHQSACQMIVLVIFLPVLVYDCVQTFTDKNQGQEIVFELQKRQECFALLQSVVNVCMAYSISESAADYLARMIQSHHSTFVDLYPGRITPKFHFLIHAVFYIKLFGPLRQQACFRFEALHAYFKALLSVTRSTRNMPYTASYRFQARRACHLASAPGQSARRFLADTPTYSGGMSVLVCNLPDSNLFNDFVNVEEQTSCRVMRTQEATIDGVTYREGTVLLWRLPEDDFPEFVKVEEMFVLRGELLLKVAFLSSLEHCPSLNSYRVQGSANPSMVIKLVNLESRHALLTFTVSSKVYVYLLFHCRVEQVV